MVHPQDAVGNAEYPHGNTAGSASAGKRTQRGWRVLALNSPECRETQLGCGERRDQTPVVEARFATALSQRSLRASEAANLQDQLGMSFREGQAGHLTFKVNERRRLASCVELYVPSINVFERPT